MNAVIEPRLAEDSAFALLARARMLIEAGEFAAAVGIYRPLLAGDLTLALRGEILANLGAALCLMARDEVAAVAQERLDEARDLLIEALPYRPHDQMPAAWATTRANLVLVHLARYRINGDSTELLSAHLALDGIDDVLWDHGETALLGWIAAIREDMLQLRKIRGARRPL